MLDYMKFPIGDIDTWRSYTPTWTAGEERHLSERLDDSSLARLLLTNGVRELAPRAGDRDDCLRLLDTWSGLQVEHITEEFIVCGGAGPEMQLAARCREALAYKSARGASPVAAAIRARDRDPLFAAATHPYAMPIADYKAESVPEIEACLTDIKSIVSGVAKFGRLWLRGQTQEYSDPRNGPTSSSSKRRTCPNAADSGHIHSGPGSHYVWIVASRPAAATNFAFTSDVTNVYSSRDSLRRCERKCNLLKPFRN